MLFSFLNYLQPTHYFRLKGKGGDYIYPRADLLPKEVVDQLQAEPDFISQTARDYDLSWQAIQLGYIGDVERYQEFQDLSIEDNYRFIRRNFSAAWVMYVLLLRLIGFHDPIKEIKAWYKTKSTKRSKIYLRPLQYKHWSTFQSDLLSKNPFVSVIIPTLNRYDFLTDVLRDFEKQTCDNFEVIIVDQSEPYQPEFYQDFNLNIRLLRQEEKALWLARNTAIKMAKGELIALSEDDVRIKPDWLMQHIKCLDFFDADISAGVFYPNGKSIPQERSYFAMASQFATGNAMLYKKVFSEIGLFDRQFEKQRMGDGEFGLRAYINGYKSISNPFGSCIDIKADSGGLREMGSWDAFRPAKLFSPRPIPSVVYFFRRYFGNKATRLSLLRTIPISLFPYKYKKNKLLLFLAGLLSIILMPVLVYQVYRSWVLATKKLEEGPKIEKLQEGG